MNRIITQRDECSEKEACTARERLEQWQLAGHGAVSRKAFLEEVTPCGAFCQPREGRQLDTQAARQCITLGRGRGIRGLGPGATSLGWNPSSPTHWPCAPG